MKNGKKRKNEFTMNPFHIDIPHSSDAQLFKIPKSTTTVSKATEQSGHTIPSTPKTNTTSPHRANVRLSLG
jgi:hypothetical protein